MLKPVLAVKDVKIGLFDPPFIVIHNEVAIREWDIITKNTDNKYGKHPVDYELYQIGTYNELTGKLDSLASPLHLATGAFNGTTV